MGNIPIDNFQSLAEIEPMPISDRWYLGVAWVLMLAKRQPYTLRAVEYFNQAIELNTRDSWAATQGLAWCYANLGQYGDAIYQIKKAISRLPCINAFEGTRLRYMTFTAEWYLELGDEKQYIETAKQAYETGSRSMWSPKSRIGVNVIASVKTYIVALYRVKAYEQLTELLYSLDGRETSEENISLWIVFLVVQYYLVNNVSIFEKVDWIARSTGNSAIQIFMHKSIEKLRHLSGILPLEDEHIAWLTWQAAQWQYSHAAQAEESMELWERVIDFVDKGNDIAQHQQLGLWTAAASTLGLMHFQAAKAHLDAGRDASIHVAKLESLAMQARGSKKYYRASYPAPLLGHWRHEYLKSEEDVWRACIRPSIKQALYLLTDEDSWNDQQAYGQLGAALMASKDIHNASIAIGITMRPLEDAQRASRSASGNETIRDTEIASIPEGAVSQDSRVDGPVASTEMTSNTLKTSDQATTTTRDHEEIDSSAMELPKPDVPKYAGFECMWSCDGPCETPKTEYRELHFCRVCNDICFCEECIALVKGDKMPYRCCYSDHSHVQMFLVSEDARRITDALIERRFAVQQEWLDGLRKEWGL